MRRENILCFMKNLQKISRAKDLPRASGFFGATTTKRLWRLAWAGLKK
jgi:hypothetical protein